MAKQSIGIYGLGVMGKNLALNIEENGYPVSVYNRSEGEERHLLTDFMEQEASQKQIKGFRDIDYFVRSLKPPRIIVIMVPAGEPVEQVIEQLLPLLEENDIVIDGGNSHFSDTERRTHALRRKGILFVGMGVSGGEEGARNGPSLMPGGNSNAWKHLKPLLQSIAARTPNGDPCCSWIGANGAGHFVKMVHNGIEYADMQLLAECYHFMLQIPDMNHHEMAHIIEQWNSGYLNSFLTEITIDIFRKTDTDSTPLLIKVLDVAGHKGTGKWTALAAHNLGIPLPVISQAVMQRYLSACTKQRRQIHSGYSGLKSPADNITKDLLPALQQAFTAGRILAHNEGFRLIREASNHYSWDIDLSSVTRIWQGGCILQSHLMKHAEDAFINNYDNLLLSPHFKDKLDKCLPGLRTIVSRGAANTVPLPAFSAALSSFDAYNSGRLPISLIQAQRDCFGAHTYERTDKPRGEFFHSNWKSK